MASSSIAHQLREFRPISDYVLLRFTLTHTPNASYKVKFAIASMYDI